MDETYKPSNATFDAAKGKARVHHDWDGDVPLSVTIVRAVAAVTGTTPLDVEPLYSVIDPDALEAAFDPASPTVPRTNGSISFPLEGCEITVEASGEITIDTENATLDPSYS